MTKTARLSAPEPRRSPEGTRPENAPTREREAEPTTRAAIPGSTVEGRAPLRVLIRARRYTVRQRRSGPLGRRRPTVGAVPFFTEQVWTTTLAELGGRLPPTGAAITTPDGLLVQIEQLTYVMATAAGGEAHWEIVAR